jgi:excinuclease UvrABC nuclease subunit
VVPANKATEIFEAIRKQFTDGEPSPSQIKTMEDKIPGFFTNSVATSIKKLRKSQKAAAQQERFAANIRSGLHQFRASTKALARLRVR